MKIIKKRIELFSNKTSFSYSVCNSSSTDKAYTLIIPGWQALKEIFTDLISYSNKKFIIFDYPGIGANKKIPPGKNSSEYLKHAIKELFYIYDIDKVIATSAGTAFVMSNLNIFPRTCRLLLMAPQISVSLLDRFLQILFTFFIILNKLFKSPIYFNFMNNRRIKELWSNVVSKNSKNKKTKQMVKKGIEAAHSYWTPKQFNELIKQKNYVRKHMSEILTDERIFFLVGEKDNLTDVKKLKKFLETNSIEGKIYMFNSNHVLELEALEDISNFIFS